MVNYVDLVHTLNVIALTASQSAGAVADAQLLHHLRPQGELIQGLDIKMPHRVRLLKRADQSLLIDLSTGRGKTL